MSAVTRMLAEAEEAADNASGAVREAIVDLRKEVAYLAGELNVGGSADAREQVIAAATAKVAKLRKRLDKILEYQAAQAQGFAAKGARQQGFDVKLSEKRAKAVLDSVQKAGGGGMAATMTRAMEANVTNALRNAVVAAFNENALAGGTARDLSKIIRQKWEAALKDPSSTTFVDRAGRTWDTETYLMMNIRTNSMKVFNESIQAQAVEGGDDLVRVTSGGDPDCRLCFPWEGRILSVTGRTKGLPTVDQAEAAGLFHPNCTHHLLPVDEEFARDEIDLQIQFPPTVEAVEERHEGEQGSAAPTAPTKPGPTAPAQPVPAQPAPEAASPEAPAQPTPAKPTPEITPESADQARYDMDIARKMRDEGVTAEEGRVLVDRDNLENAIRQGLIKTEKDSRAIVDAMTDAQVNAICGGNGNPPEFSPAKDNGGEEAWNKGKRGGVVYVDPKHVSAENILKVTAVEEGTPYGPYRLKYTPPAKRSQPEPGAREKSPAELAAEEIAAIEADMEKFWKRASDFEMSVQGFTDGPLLNAMQHASEAYAELKGAAMAKTLDERWLRANVGQAVRIEKIALGYGTTQSDLAREVSSLKTTGDVAAKMLEAARNADTSDASTDGGGTARKVAAEAAKAALADVEQRANALAETKRRVERLDAVVDTLLQVGHEVLKDVAKYERASEKVSRVAVNERASEEVRRVTPLEAGLTPERIAEIRQTPLAEALRATTKLTDRVDEMQKAVEQRVSKAKAERIQRFREIETKYAQSRNSINSIREAIREGGKTSAERVAAGLGALASDADLLKRWRTYEKTQTARGNPDFSTVDGPGNPRDAEAIAQGRERAMVKFLMKRRDDVWRKEREEQREARDAEARTVSKASVMNALATDNPGHVKEGDVAASRRTRWEIAKEIVEGFVDASVLPGHPVNVRAISGRAFHSKGSINVDASNEVKTYLHEFAHAIEFFNPHVHRRCQEFLLMRANGSGTTSPESLRSLTGLGYRSSEKTLKDKFFNPYCGKVYGSLDVMEDENQHGTIRRYGVRATEILSMGLERIYENAAEFWRTDREYFTFVTNVLQGRL